MVKDKFEISDEEIKKQLEKGKEEWEKMRKEGIFCSKVWYDRNNDKIGIEFTTGIQVLIPRKNIEELKNVPKEVIEKFEFDEDTITWRSINVGYDPYGLVLNVLNVKKLFESYAGKRAGKVKSEAKAKAARENGKKGGRPSKKKRTSVDTKRKTA